MLLFVNRHHVGSKTEKMKCTSFKINEKKQQREKRKTLRNMVGKRIYRIKIHFIGVELSAVMNYDDDGCSAHRVSFTLYA